jgi:hypothetical protein
VLDGIGDTASNVRLCEPNIGVRRRYSALMAIADQNHRVPIRSQRKIIHMDAFLRRWSNETPGNTRQAGRSRRLGGAWRYRHGEYEARKFGVRAAIGNVPT